MATHGGMYNRAKRAVHKLWTDWSPSCTITMSVDELDEAGNVVGKRPELPEGC